MAKRIITFDFLTPEKLYLAYMPFVLNGGIFISTKETFELQEDVGLDLCFLDDPERFVLDGKVVWLTPMGAQGGKPAGIGVQFEAEKGPIVRSKIETHLAGKVKSTNLTDTM